MHLVTISQLRDRLGHYVTEAERNGTPTLIRRGRREAAAIVTVGEFDLLRNVQQVNMGFKARDFAEEMMRWRILREGVELLRDSERLAEASPDPGRLRDTLAAFEAWEAMGRTE